MADDLDCVRLVLERLGPWSRGRCACVNTTWRLAAAEAAGSEGDKKHWLVNQMGWTLSMRNVVTGYEQKVNKLNLPSFYSHMIEGHLIGWNSRVLCSITGLLLICVVYSRHETLILGDPLLNKWIKLPSPPWEVYLAGSCPSSGTLLISNKSLTCNATFNIQTAEWKVDPPGPSPEELKDFSPSTTQACCLDGVFYLACRYNRRGNLASTIACYDPVNGRAWRRVKDFHRSSQPSRVCVVTQPVFLAGAQAHDRMLACKLSNDEKFELFEVVKPNLELVRSPLDKRVAKIETYFRDEDDIEEVIRAFYGRDGVYFWERRRTIDADFNDEFIPDKIIVLFDKEDAVREFECDFYVDLMDYCIYHWWSLCYYVEAPGTQGLLASLESKLQAVDYVCPFKE